MIELTTNELMALITLTDRINYLERFVDTVLAKDTPVNEKILDCSARAAMTTRLFRIRKMDGNIKDILDMIRPVTGLYATAKTFNLL